MWLRYYSSWCCSPDSSFSSSSSRRWPAGQSHHPSSSGNAVILQQKPLQAQQQGRQKSSNHMAVYSAHAQRSVGRYQYRQPIARASTPTRSKILVQSCIYNIWETVNLPLLVFNFISFVATRRLGDLGNIYIGGTSIGWLCIYNALYGHRQCVHFVCF